VEADESSDLVCYSLDRVVERKARVPWSHVERKRAAIRIHRAKEVPPCRVPVLENMGPMLDEERILNARVASDHRRTRRMTGRVTPRSMVICSLRARSTVTAKPRT